jgi:hypothetical protein
MKKTAALLCAGFAFGLVSAQSVAAIAGKYRHYSATACQPTANATPTLLFDGAFGHSNTSSESGTGVMCPLIHDDGPDTALYDLGGVDIVAVYVKDSSSLTEISARPCYTTSGCGFACGNYARSGRLNVNCTGLSLDPAFWNGIGGAMHPYIQVEMQSGAVNDKIYGYTTYWQ